MKCQHPACHCKGNEVGKNGYCSDRCRQGQMDGGKCGCGHSDCR